MLGRGSPTHHSTTEKAEARMKEFSTSQVLTTRVQSNQNTAHLAAKTVVRKGINSFLILLPCKKHFYIFLTLQSQKPLK